MALFLASIGVSYASCPEINMSGSIFKRVKKLPKKYLIIGIIFIAVIAFLFRPKVSSGSEYTIVKKQDIAETVLTSGLLAGKNTVNLNFLQGGRLAFINVKANDRVSAGQAVAGLDTQALGIELQQANNTLKDKQAAADKVLDDIHLFQYGNGGFGNVGSSSETMTQRQLRTAAEAARDNAFDNVRSVERNFQDKFIIAPFGGLVTQANVFPGQLVGSSSVVAQVVDDSEIYFDAEVDEADLGKISLDQPVEVALDAYPDQVFKGKIAEILPQTKVTSTQATVITARVLLEPGIRFIAGLQGQASIITKQAEGILTVPLEVLRPDNTVVVQTPNGLQSVKVKTGIQSDMDIQILEGLEEGQEVMINPPADLPQKRQGAVFGPLRISH